jgi:uncharacterized membrane protein YkvA (DUF1232 family)
MSGIFDGVRLESNRAVLRNLGRFPTAVRDGTNERTEDGLRAMTDIQSRCLDAFPQWLRTLGDDARALAQLLEQGSLPEGLRRHVAGALNYLFKSLDLIPDGIEDLGFIDDAFVFRASAAAANDSDAGLDKTGTLARLATEAALIRDFLGADYARLERYVQSLQTSASRGRSVDDILKDTNVCAAFVGEVSAWASSYAAPSFARDEKNLIKLKSFLTTKLPA